MIAAALWAGPALAQQPSAPAAAPDAGAPAAPNATPAANPAPASHPPTPDDICRALEQDAAENELPVEFFARVIWQESRFNARAVSNKGAQGIAQFMPATADYRGLVDPVRSDRGAGEFGALFARSQSTLRQSRPRRRGL